MEEVEDGQEWCTRMVRGVRRACVIVRSFFNIGTKNSFQKQELLKRNQSKNHPPQSNEWWNVTLHEEGKKSNKLV